MAVEQSASWDPMAIQGVNSAISNAMVGIYKEQFGRGPTKTRTQWAGTDTVVVTLEQTFTRAERRLVELGEHTHLRDLRLLFQYAETDIICEPIERLTGRKVRAANQAGGHGLPPLTDHPSAAAISAMACGRPVRASRFGGRRSASWVTKSGGSRHLPRGGHAVPAAFVTSAERPFPEGPPQRTEDNVSVLRRLGAASCLRRPSCPSMATL